MVVLNQNVNNSTNTVLNTVLVIRNQANVIAKSPQIRRASDCKYDSNISKVFVAMPPPLHLPYIIGNDICRIARIRRILNGRLSRQFVHRILTTEEIEHATTARILRCVLEGDSQRVTSKEKGKEDVSFTRAIEFMAGRFAAKEAVIKAHPHRRLTFQCIAILRMRFGSQGAVEETTTKDDEEREDEVGEGEKDEDEPRSEPLVAFIKADGRHPDAHATVSISHDTEYATAVCLGVSPAVPLVADAERGSKGRE